MQSPVHATSSTGSFVLLAPRGADVPATFRNVEVDHFAHASLLAGVQRLRGATYLADGALTSDALTPDGRHVQAVDADSWHIVSLDERGEVVACCRHRPVPASEWPDSLGIWRSALARSATWSRQLRSAIAQEIGTARQLRMQFAEFGGWAVAPGQRGAKGAMTALWTYALAESMGGAIAVATATVRNSSACILKRIGGRPIALDGEALPAYFDPQYGCEMEILRFDTHRASPKYQATIARLAREALFTPVICAAVAPAPALPADAWHPAVAGQGYPAQEVLVA